MRRGAALFQLADVSFLQKGKKGHEPSPISPDSNLSVIKKRSAILIEAFAGFAGT